MTAAGSLAPQLQAFFAEHLLIQKRASPQTVVAYRDTFRLLLRFVRTRSGIEPAAMRIEDLDAPTILSFLDHLEEARANSVRSRNARLAAIRSFFRFVALCDPESVVMATRVLAIPVKRGDRRVIGYLTKPEMEVILAAPDRSTWAGRRDHALLLTIYNSGARVSEIATVRRSQVAFGVSTTLQLFGKGRKERTVPLWPKTSRILQSWWREVPGPVDGFVFPNARRGPLTRDGVAYVLEQAVATAAAVCPSLRDKHVSPHVLRHTTAMHLLQAGVDCSVIALWLGHERLETTHMYIEADVAMKEKALANLAPPATPVRRFKADDALLGFLAGL